MRLMLTSCAIVGTVLLALTGCAPEPEPEAPQPVEEAPAPEPEPEPEPVAQPGKGPECPTDHCVSVTVSGDLLFHEGLWSGFAVPTTAEGHNFDFSSLLEGMKPYLDRADLNICNMETPLADFGGPYSAFPMFSVPPEVAFAAADVGYDVCTTATNHAVDQGTEGLVRTLDTLDAAGIQHTGTARSPEEDDEVLIVEANGVKIGIVAATFSLNGLYAEHDWQVDYPLMPELAIERAQKARELGAEIVIGAQHVGTEYTSEPNWEQVDNATALAESGAFDFIVNHHSHAPQPFDVINDTPVLYGTGNAISESAPEERHLNNEFVFTRVQFAQQDDGSWATNDIAWAAATNRQNGDYRWCSVASDAPQGVCQGEAFDADVRTRTEVTMTRFEAPLVREWRITDE
ncbi:CapA family protein [Leucobacter sp. UCMA 4100]|uniref:CapA family protein n=1 Tax=Leucobacter sp. UCMA 4100 TaxID=2810534 RepID=UPI0022EA5363|nr:CapA family protein [Leucobacter sp. UCMA 4100]